MRSFNFTFEIQGEPVHLAVRLGHDPVLNRARMIIDDLWDDGEDGHVYSSLEDAFALLFGANESDAMCAYLTHQLERNGLKLTGEQSRNLFSSSDGSSEDVALGHFVLSKHCEEIVSLAQLLGEDDAAQVSNS